MSAYEIWKYVYFKSNDSGGSICKSSHILNRHLLFLDACCCWFYFVSFFFLFSFFCTLWIYVCMCVSACCLCLCKRLPYHFSSFHFLCSSLLFLLSVCCFLSFLFASMVQWSIKIWGWMKTNSNKRKQTCTPQWKRNKAKKAERTTFRYARILHVCHVSMFNRSTFVFYSISKCANTEEYKSKWMFHLSFTLFRSRTFHLSYFHCIRIWFFFFFFHSFFLMFYVYVRSLLFILPALL